MKYDTYTNIHATDDLSIFDFYSDGPNGKFLKRAEFMRTDSDKVYSLVFGDVMPNGDIDDSVISNNGDRNKILATLAYIIELYLNQYPDRWVYFIGNTLSRTRLYRMAISTNYIELSMKFSIYTHIDNVILPFQKNTPLSGLFIRIKS